MKRNIQSGKTQIRKKQFSNMQVNNTKFDNTRFSYMKFRYWVLIVILIAAAGICSTVRLIYHESNAKTDMVYINEQFSKIEDKINNKINEIVSESPDSEYDNTQINSNIWVNNNSLEMVRKEIEKENNCRILYRTDDDYQTELYNSIKNQKIILDYELNGTIVAKIVFDGQTEKMNKLYYQAAKRVVVIIILMMAVILFILLFIYYQYVMPFRKLQNFAGNISKGNFDVPLPIKKNNYFGAFTESFDIMRDELKRAKKSEFEANKSKKELVASLSHDIKTPVATIKAVCEILMVKLKDEATLDKIIIINQKAGVIDSLISDMFHATLEDLEKLKIEPKEELSTIIQPMFDEINHYEKIHYSNKVPECMIVVDRLRLNQVIDNIINNSYKYANTDIDVLFEKDEHNLYINIQDYGAGIDSDELLLAEQKFFRGKNAEGKSGSGLGLYLSKTFMEGMGGEMILKNNNGFLVRLKIRLV